jgi:hypothetical protein
MDEKRIYRESEETCARNAVELYFFNPACQ